MTLLCSLQHSPNFDRCMPGIWPLTLTSEQSDVKTLLLIYGLDLQSQPSHGQDRPTYKNQGRRSNGSAMRSWTDRWTDWHYQVHYLPSLSYAVDNYRCKLFKNLFYQFEIKIKRNRKKSKSRFVIFLYSIDFRGKASLQKISDIVNIPWYKLGKYILGTGSNLHYYILST